MYIANKRSRVFRNFFSSVAKPEQDPFFNLMFKIYLFVCFWQDHVANDCKLFAIDCTLCDKKGILRGKLIEHQDAEFGDCEGTKAVCPFGILGCETREVMGEYYSVFSILFFSSKLRLIMKLFLECSNSVHCMSSKVNTSSFSIYLHCVCLSSKGITRVLPRSRISVVQM